MKARQFVLPSYRQSVGLPDLWLLEAILGSTPDGHHPDTAACSRHPAREVRWSDDQNIAIQMIEHALSGVADEYPAQAGTGDRAHDDNRAVQLRGGFFDCRTRRPPHQMTTWLRDVTGAQHPIETPSRGDFRVCVEFIYRFLPYGKRRLNLERQGRIGVHHMQRAAQCPCNRAASAQYLLIQLRRLRIGVSRIHGGQNNGMPVGARRLDEQYGRGTQP